MSTNSHSDAGESDKPHDLPPSNAAARGGTVKSVPNARLAVAAAKQKPSPWTKHMFKLYACLLVASLCSCVNGYDGSVLGGINTYPQYRSYFHFNPESGRKWGMFTGVLIIVVFAIVQATSASLPQFMVARFMLGLGNAVSIVASGTYVIEMAHPTYRSIIGSIFNCFWYIGGVPGNFIPYGTSNLRGTVSWRIPLWCQLIFAGIVLIFSPFLPETPRWLIANNRHEEAHAIMAEYHGDGDAESPIVQLEYKEMMEEISVTGSDKRWWDYRALFNSSESRYRSMLVISIAFITQWAGQTSISYYYPEILQGAGITDKHTQLLLNGTQTVLAFLSAMLGAIYTDKWGRRRQMLVSIFLMIIIITILLTLTATNLVTDANGALQAKRTSQSRAIIAITFIWYIVYSAGWTPLQQLYPLECLRYETRAKGMGMYNLFVSISLSYSIFVTGIAFTNIQWRYYITFIFWNILAFGFIYKFYVETRYRTLEELVEIFASPYPVKASLSKSEIIIREDEIIIHEIDKVY